MLARRFFRVALRIQKSRWRIPSAFLAAGVILFRKQLQYAAREFVGLCRKRSNTVRLL